MDDELVLEYKRLRRKLYSIKEDMKNLIYNYDLLKKVMKDTLVVENKLIFEDVTNGIGNNNKDIYDELVYEVIPAINDEI